MEPLDPLLFLQLSEVIKDTHQYVRWVIYVFSTHKCSECYCKKSQQIAQKGEEISPLSLNLKQISCRRATNTKRKRRNGRSRIPWLVIFICHRFNIDRNGSRWPCLRSGNSSKAMYIAWSRRKVLWITFQKIAKSIRWVDSPWKICSFWNILAWTIFRMFHGMWRLVVVAKMWIKVSEITLQCDNCWYC